ncbi:MAG: phage antirepressor protein [Bacilli bacterium]|nr:phage antirepressor protein [Bacilli bacterium]
MHLINKIFNNETIRTIWDKEAEKYYISVVDIVGVLSESKDRQSYWRKLKQRLREEGNETVTNCHALKLIAQDGKYRLTDVVDIEGMFRIIESVPSKNAEPIKQWLARLGKERIDEVFDPSLTVQRAIDTYRAKGYDEDWIIKRIKGIQDRKKLTDTWKKGRVTEEVEFAILTNDIYKEWSGMTAKEYKQYKGLRKESLRDNMSELEVALADIGELTTRKLVEKHNPIGLEENRKIAQEGGQVASNTRKDIEARLGESVVTKDNALSYQYMDEINQIENK